MTDNTTSPRAISMAAQAAATQAVAAAQNGAIATLARELRLAGYHEGKAAAEHAAEVAELDARLLTAERKVEDLEAAREMLEAEHTDQTERMAHALARQTSIDWQEARRASSYAHASGLDALGAPFGILRNQDDRGYRERLNAFFDEHIEETAIADTEQQRKDEAEIAEAVDKAIFGDLDEAEDDGPDDFDDDPVGHIDGWMLRKHDGDVWVEHLSGERFRVGRALSRARRNMETEGPDTVQDAGKDTDR